MFRVEELKETRKLAKVLSLVENRGTGYLDILKECFKASRTSRLIGITGPPGAGKSTLTSAMIKDLVKEGKSVAVLAIDPSSAFSGGALLGDRIRMMDVSLNKNVFIRSSATRGAMGGLSSSTSDMITVLEAANFDYILVETVGVGQDEIDVVKETDSVLLVLVPGLGDDIQALKAGVMEIADIFVINKSDKDGSEKLEREIEYNLTLSQIKKEWIPKVVKTVASSEMGISSLVSEMKNHYEFLVNSETLLRKREERYVQKLRKLLLSGIESRIKKGPLKDEEEEKLRTAFLKREKDPYTIAEEIVESFSMEEI
jgi:LAO/AO transport system kinase